MRTCTVCADAPVRVVKVAPCPARDAIASGHADADASNPPVALPVIVAWAVWTGVPLVPSTSVSVTRTGYGELRFSPVTRRLKPVAVRTIGHRPLLPAWHVANVPVGDTAVSPHSAIAAFFWLGGANPAGFSMSPVNGIAIVSVPGPGSTESAPGVVVTSACQIDGTATTGPKTPRASCTRATNRFSTVGSNGTVNEKLTMPAVRGCVATTVSTPGDTVPSAFTSRHTSTVTDPGMPAHVPAAGGTVVGPGTHPAIVAADAPVHWGAPGSVTTGANGAAATPEVCTVNCHRYAHPASPAHATASGAMAVPFRSITVDPTVTAYVAPGVHGVAGVAVTTVPAAFHA